VSRTLGQQIADGRKAAGRSLRDLAAALDLSPSYLNDIEHGRRTPSAAVIDALADELELDANGLMAAAGRVGEGAEEYMRRSPNAGVLLRTVSNKNLTESQLQQLIQKAERM
jgi:transcriptional regulator with XRE-family HTH domain